MFFLAGILFLLSRDSGDKTVPPVSRGLPSIRTSPESLEMTFTSFLALFFFNVCPSSPFSCLVFSLFLVVSHIIGKC